MALADARARLPTLRAVPQDRRADHALLDELAELATSFTPSVALEEPNGLTLDITGCVHLFGSEAGLAARLRGALHARGVSQCRLAVAATPDMARALARFGREAAVLVHDDRAARALPVAALECGPQDALALRRAGLETIGDVAARPSVLFSARFSEAFTIRLARILGEEDRRITPRRMVAPLVFDHRCAEPLASNDAIELALADLVRRACLELEERGEGGRKLEAAFFRTDGAIRRIPIETSRPTRDPAVILRLYRDRLDAIADPLDPGFGFDLIRFAVLHAQDSTSMQTSLDAREAGDDRVAALCDRLAAMFGRERVTRLAAVDTHVPERAQMPHSASDEPPAARRCRFGHEHERLPPRPITLFARPHPVEIPVEIMSGPPAAAPQRFRWRRKVHEVVRAEGPERIAEEWWRPASGFGTRDYFRIETAEGRRFWMFRSQAASAPSQGAWFLHGVFS